MDDTEAQMRRALGLFGETPRPRAEPDRSEPAPRPMDRHTPGGHRRRFVQDGDVPVTIVRRDVNADPLASRPAATVAPTQSRLQRTEAALAQETAARVAAERALAEAQATIRDLQTKIGHAELARTEAVDALHKEREAHATQHAELEEHHRLLAEANEKLKASEEALETFQTELSDEREARRMAERSLQEAIAARESAELLLNELSEQAAPVPAPPPAKARATTRRTPSVRRLKAAPAPVPEVEPEPVKWWLMAAPKPKRR